jgi:hypothetical protein
MKPIAAMKNTTGTLFLSEGGAWVDQLSPNRPMMKATKKATSTPSYGHHGSRYHLGSDFGLAISLVIVSLKSPLSLSLWLGQLCSCEGTYS